MRRTRVAAPALAASVVLVACRAPRPAAFAIRARDEFSALADGVTPNAWLQNHPTDVLVRFSPAADREHLEHWCARSAQRAATATGDTVWRAAYFYVPEPPAGLALPATGDSAELVRGRCLLGAIWVEAPVPDSFAGQRLGAEVKRSLSQVYGAVKAGPDRLPERPMTDSQRRALDRFGGFEALRMGLSFPGSAYWRAPGRWETGATTFVSAYDPGSLERARGRILAAAYLPRSGLELDWRSDRRDSEALRQRDDSLLAAVARGSGLDAAATAALLALRGPSVADSTRIPALRRWLAAAAAWDAPRRAAALLVADAVVPAELDRPDSVRAASYGELGARFVYSELGATYNYTHAWLEQARDLDSSGPAGRFVALQLLRSGFNTNGMCSGGTDAFRRVVTEGEAWLAASGDSALDAEVHALVGDAYADIVALAGGAGDEYADSSAYRREAPAARLKAVEHYRAALVRDPGSPNARAIWLEAWRLLAGLPPTTTHFFCVYD